MKGALTLPRSNWIARILHRVRIQTCFYDVTAINSPELFAPHRVPLDRFDIKFGLDVQLGVLFGVETHVRVVPSLLTLCIARDRTGARWSAVRACLASVGA